MFPCPTAQQSEVVTQTTELRVFISEGLVSGVGTTDQESPLAAPGLALRPVSAPMTSKAAPHLAANLRNDLSTASPFCEDPFPHTPTGAFKGSLWTTDLDVETRPVGQW